MMTPHRRFTFFFVFLLPLLFSLNQAEARWWKDEKIKAELKLTEKQTSEMDKLFDESQKKREARAPKVEKKMEELNVLLKGEGLDEKKAKEAVDELLALQAENFREMVAMKVKIRKLLSKEQLKTLNDKYPNILSPSSRWAAGDRMFKRMQRDKPSKKEKSN